MLPQWRAVVETKWKAKKNIMVKQSRTVYQDVTVETGSAWKNARVLVTFSLKSWLMLFSPWKKLSVFVLEIWARGFGNVDMVETCSAYAAHLHVEYLSNCCHGVFIHHHATSNTAVLSQVQKVCIKPGRATEPTCMQPPWKTPHDFSWKINSRRILGVVPVYG